MRTLQNPFAGPVVYKRKPHTASHKTDRREIAALVVAMLIFFIGLPGHTSNTMVSTQHMAKHLVRLVLVMLGVASPVAPPVATHISSPAATQIASKATAPRSALIHTPAPKKAAVETMSLNSLSTNSFLQRYTYRFDGIASHRGLPCPNASVLVRVMTNQDTFTRRGMTNDDGSYSIEVPILAAEGVPVDWHVEAFSSEFKKLEHSGRRIVKEEEELEDRPIVVNTPVEFVISLSK